MKLINLTLILSFFFQANLAMACQTHGFESRNIDQPVSHCHETSSSKDQKKKGNKNNSDCPVCLWGLCVQTHNTIIKETVLKAKKYEVENLVEYLPPTSLALPSKLFRPMALMLVHVLLPQHRNWQAFYSVFLN